MQFLAKAYIFNKKREKTNSGENLHGSLLNSDYHCNLN